MNRFYLTTSVAAIGVLMASHTVYAQEEIAGTGDQDPVVDENQVVDEVVSTGTRLGVADLSSRVDSITAEDIEARGLSTLEDVIRSIPQNFSTNNSLSSLGGSGPNEAAARDLNLGVLGVGTSTANLRGLGSANTLVLLNGKRLSAAAGQDDFFANLRDIPASAIERVEIQLDGGSSIYGSDAVGGVINIILKKNYTGAQASARYEHSSTDADQWRANGYLGYGWGSGSISGTFSYTDQKAATASKTGFVTRDFRDQFNGNPAADQRDQRAARAGILNASLFSFIFSPDGVLPPDNDGANAQPGDFVAFNPDADVVDLIGSELGSNIQDLSLTLNAEQRLFDGFNLRGEILYTHSETDAVLTVSPAFFEVPASNAFNNFGAPVGVFYTPLAEIESGLLPQPMATSDTEQFRYRIGFDYDVTDKISIVADYVNSETTSDGLTQAFLGLESNFFTGELGPTFFNTLTDAGVANLVDILSSSDPNVALNPFGDGSAQNPGIADFLVGFAAGEQVSFVREFNGYVRGDVFDLPAGSVTALFGGEVRTEGLRGDSNLGTGPVTSTGVDEPARDLHSFFGEVAIPVFGGDFTLPGAQSLTFNFSIRHDSYTIDGADGTTTSGDPNLVTAAFSATSERYGVAWSPIDDLLIRASYAEAFRAPTFRDLFDVGAVSFPTTQFDPLAGPGGAVVPAVLRFGGTIDLMPENSVNVNVGGVYTPSWAQGLRMSLDYTKIDFENRIVPGIDLLVLLGTDVVASNPDVFVRDENGQLQVVDFAPVNVAERLTETIDGDISYQFDTGWGAFTSGVNVHYVIKQTDTLDENSDPVSLVGQRSGVDRYHLQGRLNWEYDNIGVNLIVDHTPAYDNPPLLQSPNSLDLPTQRIDSRTTVDLTASYVFDNGLTLRAGARNLLNADFPFGVFSGGRSFDETRIDVRGRVAFFEASYDFSGLFNRN